ncbi:glycosyltransferase family 87 protein [Nocardia sp. alder85J]|uniref:glycosyltransferase family 87 protein n=1 Tax=Nocardia sp. alder85J TaxID=2862949 RepID=UPI001CD5BE8B|nr:glycosyltransferase family 87 protein [Nocardia sp. alder85J]MCX4094798.1 glycosyltransferase family 87 protein [Nocardia sp. alder85J]
MFLSQLEPRTARTTSEVLNFALWPFAVLTALRTVLVKGTNFNITDDFAPVYKASLAFLNGRAIYNENFDLVDPHYLYPPSGTLMIAPLALIDPEKSKWCFVALNAVAIVLAWYLLLRLFKVALKSPAAPGLLVLMFSSETVINTLAFGNVNGCLLAAEVIFLALVLRRRDLWAGVVMGLTIAVKPTLAPLLLIPLLRGQWKVFITALGVPAVLMAAAWPLIKDPMDFVHRTFPYFMGSRDYFNSAIVGNAAYYGLPVWLTWSMRLVMGALVLISLWLLYRYYRNDELFFVTTMSGVLLIASWLLPSLGQQYYSMLVFPFLMSVALRNSVLRNWPAWLAIFGFMTYDKWLLDHWQSTGRALEYLRVTFGWGLLLVVVFCVLGDRYLAARREGRLDSGIDPAFLLPADQASAVGAGPDTPPASAVGTAPKEQVSIMEGARA